MQRCDILIGCLISHPCSLKAKRRCPKCKQLACLGHLSAQKICVICAGEYTPPKAIHRVSFEEMFRFEADDYEAFETQQAELSSREWVDDYDDYDS